MLAMLKRLFGGSRHRTETAKSRRRSATGDVLARTRNPAPPDSRSPRKPAGGDAGTDDFDPYNTGKFDRAASWERVRHSHR